MVRRFRLFFAGILLVHLTVPVQAEETLHIAVAANFSAPARTLATLFEIDCHCTVVISTGSTGMLFAQVVHGAPYDVFLAANKIHPQQLEQQGLIIEGARRTYAYGQLVWWQPKGQGVTETQWLNWQQPLALANPKLAPYGAAAANVLERFGDAAVSQVKRIQGNNVAQTFQFIDSGNVAAGFVALSQVGDRPANEYWIIPTDYYSAIEQQLVILKSSKQHALAKGFNELMQSADGIKLITNAGYRVNDEMPVIQDN